MLVTPRRLLSRATPRRGQETLVSSFNRHGTIERCYRQEPFSARTPETRSEQNYGLCSRSKVGFQQEPYRANRTPETRSEGLRSFPTTHFKNNRLERHDPSKTKVYRADQSFTVRGLGITAKKSTIGTRRGEARERGAKTRETSANGTRRGEARPESGVPRHERRALTGRGEARPESGATTRETSANGTRRGEARERGTKTRETNANPTSTCARIGPFP